MTLGDVAPLLRAHLPEDDPLLPYADALSAPALGEQGLRGYLTGSVDVVLRLPVAGASRYLVVDYKTNWLGGLPGTGVATLTSDDYRPEVLRAAMAHSDYPLQALLYAVVLHRFLRWRQPGYDPEQHLGGVLYLYLRGMCGPDDPAGRRPAVRRVRVAPAGRPGRGDLRPPRRLPCGGGVVTELVEFTDAADARLALGATGLLHDFNAAGVLTAADVHVAARIGRLAGEHDERVLLAVALATRAVRHGSVGVDLRTVADVAPELPWPDPDTWAEPVAASAVVAARRGAAGAGAALPRPLPAAGGPALRRPAGAAGEAASGGRRRLRSRRACCGSSPATRTTSSAPRAGAPHAVDHGAHRRPGHRQDDHGRRAAGRCWPSSSSSPASRRCASR